jgi:hypothetical protein
MYNIFYFYLIHTGGKLGTKQLHTFGFRTFHLKIITVTSTKIDSSHESGKNVITWTWPASTTIIYNNHVSCKRKGNGLIYTASIVGILFAEKNECTVFRMRYF